MAILLLYSEILEIAKISCLLLAMFAISQKLKNRFGTSWDKNQTPKKNYVPSSKGIGDIVCQILWFPFLGIYRARRNESFVITSVDYNNLWEILKYHVSRPKNSQD